MFFFFNDTATTEIYTLSLHDALPIFALFAAARGTELCEPRFRGHRPAPARARHGACRAHHGPMAGLARGHAIGDRKSTRLNSSHANISYAVFCLKKKNHATHP